MNQEPRQPEEPAIYHASLHDGTGGDYFSPDYRSPSEIETYEATGLPTTASGSPIPFPHTSPRDFQILREVTEGLPTVHNRHVYEMTSSLLHAFQRALKVNRDTVEFSRNLPPLRFRVLDDGSALIEWIFKDFRIGFSIEPENADSSWYLVSNQNLNEVSKSGPLDAEAMDAALLEVLGFVLNYT